MILAVLNGAIAGMAGITPVSGYINGPYAALVAIIITLSAYFGIWLLKGKLKIDDALDVSSVHGITGIIGSLSIGFVASQGVNPDGPNGWFYGNFSQVYIQFTAVALTILWSAFWTSLLIICFRYTKFFKLTVEEEVEILGLDYYYHGDVAYYSLETPEIDTLEGNVEEIVPSHEKNRLIPSINIDGGSIQETSSNRRIQELQGLMVPAELRKTLSAKNATGIRV